jgi:hypothetical protein
MSISINGSTGISGVVGTASTPALIGTDADTGLYFPTANEVALATAGSQRLLIDSSGNIVIGGTLTSGSFIPTSSTVPTNGIYLSAANTVAVATNGAGRLFVDASGRLGVGTASPSSLFHLSGNSGTAVFTLSDPANGMTGKLAADPTTLSLGTTTNHAVLCYTNSVERLRITSAGLLGIGSSIPVFLTDILSGTANTGANVNNPSQLSITGPNKTLTGGGATVFVNSNSDLAIDTGGSIALSGRNTTSSTNSVVWGVVKGAKENATSTNTAGYLAFASANHGAGGLVEAMRIDSSQRLGIGTTTVSSNLHIKPTTGDDSVFTNGLRVERNDTSGQYGLFNYAGGAANITAVETTASNPVVRFLRSTNGSTTTETARFDASGRFLVGTSTTSKDFSAVFQGNSADATGGANLLLARGTSSPADGSAIGYLSFTDSNHNATALIQAQRDGGTWDSGASQPGRLVFSTTANGAGSPTERMRIGQNGGINTYTDSANYLAVRNNGTSSVGNAFIVFKGATSVTDGTLCMVIRQDGDLENLNNAYGAYSDIKLKENIVDAASQWDDLKALQVRKYNFKPETGHSTHTQIGLVAQEVELVSPGLVSESPDRDEDGNDLGTVTKSVNYSVLYMKAIKALQEAMERIETLEAQNSDFATRLTALESA